MTEIGAPNSIMRHMHSLPEPTAPRTDYHVRTSTPWGTAQSATHYTRGIVFYSTAGHGGIHVSKTLLARIPAYLQTADKYADGTQGWFEEDCGWAIPVLCLPEFFPLQMRLDALETVRRYHPEEYTRYLTENTF